MEELLGKYIEGKEGREVAVSTLADDELVGLYFTAKYCPPCQIFTPVLRNCYLKLKEAGKRFEVVYVAFDFTEEECEEYYKQMPWLLLPYADRARKEMLQKKFSIPGIPFLYFFNPKTGALLRDDGRRVVEKDPEGKNFPWLTCEV